MDKQKWKDWLGEGHFGKRLFVALLFFLALAFFLHFRQVRMESLELNTIAERYIIGQVDFSFPDEEATALLRQQAASDVGAIYRPSDKQLHQVRQEFERSLLLDSKWRDELETATFDQLYHSADALEEALLFVRFANARTLQKMRDFHLSTENYFLLSPQKGQGSGSGKYRSDRSLCSLKNTRQS